MTVIELAGSRLDDWWADLMDRPHARRIWALGGPLVVLIVATLTRLVDLGHPHELVFDETYYVKDAYTLSHLGYESSWPANANIGFNAGLTDTFLKMPSFVVHPPVGKWIIAAGIAIFGAGNSFGWRIMVALAGILLVVLTMLIAKKLFRSTLLTVVAGGLLAIDGNAIVLSRVALLDTMVDLFALLGVYFVLLDYGGSKRRLDQWMSQRRERDTDGSRLGTDWGPVLWRRPWLLAAALAFGLCSSVKWSGLWFLAGFALYSVLIDIVARRRAGITFWFSGTLLRQAPATFVLTVPLALATYVASWTGWFVTTGGYYRDWIATGGGIRWTGLLAWVPDTFQNWWHYQTVIYSYHVNEHTPHSYQANPLLWLFLQRPTSMFYRQIGGDGMEILDIANPLIWWASVAAAFYLLFRLVRGLVWRAQRREGAPSIWREGFILAGLAAGYLPWLAFLSRTVFQFYTIAFEPYLILALTFTIGVLLGRATDPESRRVAGIRLVGVFLGICVVLSIFFWPMWTGEQIPMWYLRLHYWLPSWI